MREKTKTIIIGILLLLAGAAVIYFNLRSVGTGIEILVPSIVFLAGIVLYIYYFSTRKTIYILILATFLLVAAILLFVLTFTSYEHIRYLWPGFLLALGVGLLVGYAYGEKSKAMLALGVVLVAASVVIWIFYSLKSPYGIAMGAGIFILGIAFFTRGVMKER